MVHLTKEDLATLVSLNNQRDSLQNRLVEEARKLLRGWTDLLRGDTGGYWTKFLTAELVKEGTAVAVTFEWADDPYENFGPRTEEFPIEWFLTSKWYDDSCAQIAKFAAAKEEKAARVAALKAELSALEENE